MPLLTTPAEPVAQVVLVVTRVRMEEEPVVLVARVRLVIPQHQVQLATVVTAAVTVELVVQLLEESAELVVLVATAASQL